MLESGVVRPVGATKPRAIDVRVIAATHRDLPRAVADGRFREDLLYRLDVVAIVIPALRDRREDIPALVEHFLEGARARYPQSPVRRLSVEALAGLRRRAWPGNVRELANVVEKLVLFGRAEEIAIDELPPEARPNPSEDEPAEFRGGIVPMRDLERRYAVWAVAQTGGHRGKAAEQLGVDPKTLRKWLEGGGPTRRPSSLVTIL